MTSIRRSLACAGVALLLASPSHASWRCPRNGGVVCVAPGDPQHLCGITFPLRSDGGPEPALDQGIFVWQDSRDSTTNGRDLYDFGFLADCFDSTARTGTPLAIGPGGQENPVIAMTQYVPPFPCGPYCQGFSIIAAWQDGRGADTDIEAQRVYKGGDPTATWDSSSIPICTASGDQTHPAIAPTHDHHAIVGWLDARSGETDVYAQSVDSSGVGVWTPNGIPVCAAPGAQEDLHAVPDGANGAIFCWIDHRGPAAIYAMRLLPNGAAAPGWSVDGNLVATGVPVAGALHVSDDGAGGIVIGWTDSGSGASVVTRMDGSGAIASGWPVTTAGESIDDLTQSEGCVYVVSEFGAPSDLVGHRYLVSDASQAAGWPAVVCDDPASQTEARVIAFGTGGIFFGWTDGRSSDATSDIYAVLLAGDGTRYSSHWPANGLVITAAPGAQTTPLLVPDLRGALIAWIDSRNAVNTGTDVYAAIVDVLGEVSVGDAPGRGLALGAPRPNPARTATTFAIDAAAAGRAEVFVTDVAGRRVRSLYRGAIAPGHHELTWDGGSDGGDAVRPGLYFVRALVDGSPATRSVIMLR